MESKVKGRRFNSVVEAALKREKERKDEEERAEKAKLAKEKEDEDVDISAEPEKGIKDDRSQVLEKEETPETEDLEPSPKLIIETEHSVSSQHFPSLCLGSYCKIFLFHSFNRRQLSFCHQPSMVNILSFPKHMLKPRFCYFNPSSITQYRTS
ncbi:uncharacterized protein RAG0_10131 [Rhynchosporium agropyri]|uniref:Uncharacterized protein n=1 Tax=Rhynchosporium agropyri TaxID=914238 RepID=A0A1E1KYI9_9HELO|nr:uncharacterized protein RAG0_10131 [Rhynchosporium agropyri]